VVFKGLFLSWFTTSCYEEVPVIDLFSLDKQTYPWEGCVFVLKVVALVTSSEGKDNRRIPPSIDKQYLSFIYIPIMASKSC